MTAIFICKHDCSDDYRQIAQSAKAVAQTHHALGMLALVYIRLTFGRSPDALRTRCCFSELATDLANEISMCGGWESQALRSPDEPIMPLCPYASSDDSVPFGPAWPSTAVTVPPIITGKVDGFVDDLINDFLDTVDNCHRQPHVVPLAMFVTSCPHTEEDKETILRRTGGPVLAATFKICFRKRDGTRFVCFVCRAFIDRLL